MEPLSFQHKAVGAATLQVWELRWDLSSWKHRSVTQHFPPHTLQRSPETASATPPGTFLDLIL